MKATLVIVAVSGLLTKPSYLYRVVGAQQPSIMKVESSGQQQQLLPDAENTSLNLSRRTSLLENHSEQNHVGQKDSVQNLSGHANYRIYTNASQKGTSSERAGTAISSPTANFPFQEPLKIVAVTYNSANDFTNMITELVRPKTGILDQGHANVALVCTQEATKPIVTNTMYQELQNTGWQFLKSCQNRGATLTGFNWQELAIFVKLPTNFGWFATNYSDLEESYSNYYLPYLSQFACRSPKVVDNETTTRRNIAVDIVNIRTGSFGKGGLVGTLKLPMQGGQSTLVAGCAHLDAYDKHERDNNVQRFVDLMVEKAPSDKRRIQVLLGDLNNRMPTKLFPDKTQTAVESLIFQHLVDYRHGASSSGQTALRKLDVLGSRAPDEFTPLLIMPGLAFSCNDPGTQIPTYKLKDGRACQELQRLQALYDWKDGDDLSEAQTLFQKGQRRELIGECYLGEEPCDERAWPNQTDKRPPRCSPAVLDFKQLGWLDRVCWKANTRGSVEDHSFAAVQRPRLEEAVLEGQTEKPFPDHGPSLVLMKISFRE